MLVNGDSKLHGMESTKDLEDLLAKWSMKGRATAKRGFEGKCS